MKSPYSPALWAALALQRVAGARPGYHYRQFLALERVSRDELHAVTERRLRDVLQRAVRDVPFYRRALHGQQDARLGDFPCVAKSDIQKHFEDFMTDALRREHHEAPRNHGYGWIAVKTGGSTGAPTTVIHDAEFRDRGRASRWYSQYLCGFPFGTPYYRLWGSMADIHATRDSLSQRTMSRLAGTITFNAFRMKETDMNHYADEMRRGSIHHLMAYVDAADHLARHIERTGAEAPRLDSIMACAGTLTDDVRDRLQKVFRARVHNKYGSRDCTDMACSCEAGGIHVYSHHVLLEVVDDQGRAVSSGATGHLWVTLLGNHSFPLIRYDIGDMARLSDKRCICGRPAPLLDRIEGRAVEFLRTTHGSYITPSFLIHLVGVVHNPGTIRRFQFVQDRFEHCRLSLESEDMSPALRECSRKMVHDLHAIFGSDCQIDVEIVRHIPETASGKFLYCINRIAPDARPLHP